jgi:YHS domain-containing protein
VVFVIADLAGYTALTEAHGGEGAAATIARYREMPRGALAEGARVIEQVGNQLLIVASEPRTAMLTALRLPAVNLTARLAARASADDVLCTRAVADASLGMAGIRFHPLGALRFKNVPQPVDVVAVVAEPVGHAVVDPVCQMHVAPDTAPARLPGRNATHYFCSFECARAFAASPESYAAAC